MKGIDTMDKGFIEFQAEPFPVQKLFDADWKLKSYGSTYMMYTTMSLKS